MSMSWSVTHLFPHARPEQAVSTFAGATFSASKSGFSGQASLSGDPVVVHKLLAHLGGGGENNREIFNFCFDLWVVSVCVCVSKKNA